MKLITGGLLALTLSAVSITGVGTILSLAPTSAVEAVANPGLIDWP